MNTYMILFDPRVDLYTLARLNNVMRNRYMDSLARRDDGTTRIQGILNRGLKANRARNRRPSGKMWCWTQRPAQLALIPPPAYNDHPMMLLKVCVTVPGSL